MRETLLSTDLIDVMFDSSITENLWEEGDARENEMRKLRSVRRNLNEEDRKLYKMAYTDQWSQQKIAEELNIKQPTVCFRLAQLTHTIRFLIQKPSIQKRTIDRNLNMLSGVRRKYVESFLKTPHQNTVAEKHSVKPTNISKALSFCEKNSNLDKRFKDYLKYLKGAPGKVYLD